jgi:predicted metal-binding protein
MMKFPAPFATAIFVCTHKRPDGHPKPCCFDRGGVDLREELREMVREQGLEGRIKVFQSGCIGACEQGPIALRYPDGQLMMGVKKEDLPGLLEESKG